MKGKEVCAGGWTNRCGNEGCRLWFSYYIYNNFNNKRPLVPMCKMKHPVNTICWSSKYPSIWIIVDDGIIVDDVVDGAVIILGLEVMPESHDLDFLLASRSSISFLNNWFSDLWTSENSYWEEKYTGEQKDVVHFSSDLKNYLCSLLVPCLPRTLLNYNRKCGPQIYSCKT